MSDTTFPAVSDAMREAVARDLRIDTQVWTAAATLSPEQIQQPEWIWFANDGTEGIPVARYSFGRWPKIGSAAPYIRADILLSGPIASEVARLTGERDATQKKLAVATETFTDADGAVWSPPTAWAYFAACRALKTVQARADAAEADLTRMRAENAAEVEFWIGVTGEAIDALDACAEDDEEGWDRQQYAADQSARITALYQQKNRRLLAVVPRVLSLEMAKALHDTVRIQCAPDRKEASILNEREVWHALLIAAALSNQEQTDA